MMNTQSTGPTAGADLEDPSKQEIHQAVVAIVDDDRSVTDSLKVLLESVGHQVETFDSAEAFLASYDPNRPGCIVLDERMPGMSGRELQQELVRRRALSPVILVTAYAGVQMAVDTMQLGAISLLEKPFREQDMLEAIWQALKQDAAARERQRDRSQIQARIDQLTPRQRDVMELVIRGLPNKSIAHELGLSERTVELHRSRMLSRTESSSVAELAYAVGRLRGLS